MTKYPLIFPRRMTRPLLSRQHWVGVSSIKHVLILSASSVTMKYHATISKHDILISHKAKKRKKRAMVFSMTLFFAVIEIFKMYPQTGLYHFYYYDHVRGDDGICVSMPLLGLIPFLQKIFGGKKMKKMVSMPLLGLSSFLLYPLANPVFMRFSRPIFAGI